MRALALALLAGCTATGGGARRDGVPFPDGELVELMFLWREGERRRDPDLAGRALHFARSSDRSHFEDELEYLRQTPAGPIRVRAEFHLVGRAEGMGEGDYLFLEPAGSTYAPTAVTVVRVRGRPRILYERPDVTEEERASRRPEEVAQLAGSRRIDHWQALEAARLEAELARLKRLLRYQAEARAYALREQLALPSFDPDPAAVLADLEGLDAPSARDHVIAVLRATLLPPRPPPPRPRP